MNACPLCRAGWPSPSGAFANAVCPGCFAVFEQQDGAWRRVPPGYGAAVPPPIALGTLLRLRGVDMRIVGFASYSYQVEYGRDQFETHERHIYSLTDLTGGNPLLLCWGWSQWWVARPVDSKLVNSSSQGDWTQATFEGRSYRRHHAETFQTDRACGFLAHPFHWASNVVVQDFVVRPFGPGGFVLMGDGASGRHWAGEFLNTPDVLLALAMREFPGNSPYRSSANGTTVPAEMQPQQQAFRPVTVSAGAFPLWRWLAAVAAALGIFVAIGFSAYQYERRTKAVSSHWFACPAEASQRFAVAPEASRLELDPHLPQGALRYDLRILNASGTPLTSRKDSLDMSNRRRTLALDLPTGSASVDVNCSLSVPIAGLRSWPMELRFYR